MFHSIGTAGNKVSWLLSANYIYPDVLNAMDSTIRNTTERRYKRTYP